MTLVTGGIGQTQVFIMQRTSPFAVQNFLQFIDDQHSGYAVADGTDNLAVLIGLAGSMSAPQNICMCMLPLSISISPSSDNPVYDLRNISATSPSGGNIGELP